MPRGKIAIPPFPESKRGRADGAGTAYPLASEDQGVTNGLVAATAAGKPYPIKAWIVYGQNVLESIPQREKTLQAIGKLDLMVVVDVMPMEQVNYADLVLPEATYLERYDMPAIVESAKTPYLAPRFPAVDPMYDTKPGWWIAKQMASRLGLDAWFPWETPDEHLEKLIAPLNTSIAALRARGAASVPGRPYLDDRTPEDGPLFATESGKIELYSATLKGLGFDPLPKYNPNGDPPPGYFRLLYGRAPVHSFARSENNEALHALMPENELWISGKSARDSGVRDGERVVLENSDGVRSFPILVKVTEGIRGDCVYMAHGFGNRSRAMHRAFGRGASDTGLMSRVKVDPIMGGTGMRVNFVRLLKNEAGG
jgi:thiosulfate reductase / polysulfide reductase chain A